MSPKPLIERFRFKSNYVACRSWGDGMGVGKAQILAMRLVFCGLKEVFVMSEQHDAALSQTIIDLQSSLASSSVEALSADGRGSQEQFWLTTLADAPMLLNLPTDYPRPAAQTSRQATCSFTLSTTTRQALATLSQQTGVPLGVTLLTAFTALLARYTQQTDFVIGCSGADLVPMVDVATHGGDYAVLPVRADMAANPSFRSLLTKTQASVYAAYEHADIPFARIVEILQVAPERSYHPLTQVLFVWQQEAASPGQAQEVDTTSFDVVLTLQATTSELRGMWHYNPDLFTETTIQRMAKHFVLLLTSIVVTPELRLAALPLVGPEERQLLVTTRNATQADYAQSPFIHRAIEAHAEAAPQSLAVVANDDQLTYAALNERANQLAHALIRRGVGPDILVGVCLERSLDMIVALLGILKAGGAYLPIDPAYPVERRAFILQDAQAPVLITRPDLARDIALPGVSLLFPEAPELQQQPLTNIATAVMAEQLAYVIYTSGSTGLPKGVQITQNSLRNLNTWYQHAFGITPHDRMSQFVGPGFDATIMEIWPCLTSGASLHIVAEEARIAPELLRDWMVTQGITISMIPTTLAEQIVVLDWPKTTALRFLLTGAEALRTYPPDHFPAAFINNYGPTETTVLVTSSQILPATAPKMLPDIGRQIANTQLYLLDDQLQLVPEGVVGELYIGGAAVGRGYAGQPDLTAERFIPDPFSQVLGARLYRTGDLCRYRADGTIEYSGRNDNQVKVRGYRIELGEIENILMQQPQVREGVVVVREDISGEKRIVAYVTTTADAVLTANALRDALQTHLPGYMLPAAFVILATLPLTANGKVDRRALPMPDASAVASQIYSAPTTPTEVKLAQIWADVLHLEQVGVTDDLFALGAHSLLATRIISRTREAFQQDVPLRVVFEQPTVAKMAAFITQMQAQPPSALLLNRIQPTMRGDFYLSDLLDQLEPLADAETSAFLLSNTGAT